MSGYRRSLWSAVVSGIVAIQILATWSLLTNPDVAELHPPVRLLLVVGSQAVVIITVGRKWYGNDRVVTYLAMLAVVWLVATLLVMRMQGAPRSMGINPLVRTESVVSAIVLFGFAALNVRLAFAICVRR